MVHIKRIGDDIINGNRNTRLANAIIKNINSGKRMQTVYADITSGIIEENPEVALTGHLLMHGLKILCCFQEDYFHGGLEVQKYDGEVYFCGGEYLPNKDATNYDVIIVDAPFPHFELQFVDKEKKYSRYPFLHEFISQVKNNSNVYIVCFDRQSSISKCKNITSIIATSSMITKENYDFFYPEYEAGVKKIYAKLRKSELRIENKRFKEQTKKHAICYFMGDGGAGGGSAQSKIGNMQSAMQDIMQRLITLEERVDGLENKVNILEVYTKKVSDALSKNWEILQLYASMEHKQDSETDLFIKKVIDKTIDEQSINIGYITATDIYIKNEEEIRVAMTDDIWNKLCGDSKRLLVTANIYYEQGFLYSNEIDYSGVCMLASKVFEIELARRFVDGYIVYLKSKGLEKNEFPSGLCIRKNKRQIVMSMDDFTLGHCPYIMGQLGYSKEDKKINRRYFIDYCKEKLLDQMSESEIEKRIRYYDAQIRHIKNCFRNPAVHKETYTMSRAKESLMYLFDESDMHSPFLVQILSDFAY